MATSYQAGASGKPEDPCKVLVATSAMAITLNFKLHTHKHASREVKKITSGGSDRQSVLPRLSIIVDRHAMNLRQEKMTVRTI